jgi:hypothetical protein
MPGPRLALRASRATMIVRGTLPRTVSTASSGKFPGRAKGATANNEQSPPREHARLGYWSLPSAFGGQAPVPHRGGPHPGAATIVKMETPVTLSERTA